MLFQLPLEADRLFEGVDDIGIGPRFMSIIRKGEWHLELGGPRNDYLGFIYLEVIPRPGQVRDGLVELIGPDVHEVEPETSLPGGVYFRVQGENLSLDHSEYLERLMIMGLTQQEGVWAQGPAFTPWIRISKEVVSKHSLVKVAQIVRGFLRASVPFLDAVETRVVVGAPEVGGEEMVHRLREEMLLRKEAVDARGQALEDEDVDTFYGCVLCQNFAPNHVCVISPSHIPYCGILSFHGAKVSYEIDPTGYIFEIPKGEARNTLLGNYSGVDSKVFERSKGAISRIHLYSALEHPMTNCGCFEVAAFYIPEVDGIGLAHRRYFGTTPIGVPFSKIAGAISGGIQVHGYKGLSVRGMRSPRFLQGDGGWERVVWVNRGLKQEVADSIPEEAYDKIATEEDTVDPLELQGFLEKVGHPVTRRFWVEGKPVTRQLGATEPV